MKRPARARAAVALLIIFAITGCAGGSVSTTPPADLAPIAWDQAYADAINAYERADYAGSSELARAAHSAAVASLGPDTSEAGAALSLLAAAELALGHFPEATAAFEGSLATLQRVPDAEPGDLAVAMGNLGELYRQQGQLERALPWLEASYQTSTQAQGPAHIDSATALAALALARHQSGALAEAEQAYGESLARMADAGATPLQLAKVRTNLSDLLIRTERADEARAMLEDVLAIERAHLPPGHPDQAYTLNTLGVLADAQGRYEDALRHYRDALAIRLEALPPGHPSIATVHANMAGAYGSLGELDEARESYARALLILRAAHGDSHPDVTSLEAELRALEEKDAGKPSR